MSKWGGGATEGGGYQCGCGGSDSDGHRSGGGSRERNG